MMSEEERLKATIGRVAELEASLNREIDRLVTEHRVDVCLDVIDLRQVTCKVPRLFVRLHRRLR